MAMNTNLRGRLKNTSLPYNMGLLPLFEAVVNSIHGVEEANVPMSQGLIEITIIRDGQQQLLTEADRRPGPEPQADIQDFIIKDNGIGFTQINSDSFNELDTEHKASKGCRGVGRLLWLKAFDRAEVDSTYEEQDGSWYRRRFTFSSNQGIEGEEVENIGPVSERSTTVALRGFRDRYRKASRKTAATIARCLLEHCLWYFVRNEGFPTITVIDGEETTCLTDLRNEFMTTEVENEHFEVKGEEFFLTHVRLRADVSREHVLGWCAGKRLVKEDKLRGMVPGLFGPIGSEDNHFCYAGYITSEFLDDTVRSERTGFDFETEPTDFFGDSEITESDIQGEVLARASAYLAGFLEDNKLLSRQRIETFVSSAPKYRPILRRVPADKLLVDPEITDRELDLLLHKHLAEIEREMLSEGHSLMTLGDNETREAYQKRLKSYLSKAEDLKMSDLANYVFHRRTIIDLLEKSLARRENGRYSKEDLIHNLIMPMGTDSNDLLMDETNLWLIDERLAFHHFLASDKTICSMPITGSDSPKEPDICALNIYDNPILVGEGSSAPMGSLVIVELKRPMRNDAAPGEEKDPIEQALGYVRRIRKGGVTTITGRPIANRESIPAYCYIICDITSSIESRCKLFSPTRTSDGLGFFWYVSDDDYRAYVEVISFDRLVKMAKERNYAFFTKLGIPSS